MRCVQALVPMVLDAASAAAVEGVLRTKRGVRTLFEHPPGVQDASACVARARTSARVGGVVRKTSTGVCPVSCPTHGARLAIGSGARLCVRCPPHVSESGHVDTCVRACGHVTEGPLAKRYDVSDSLTITDVIHTSRLRECGAGQSITHATREHVDTQSVRKATYQVRARRE